MTSSRILFFNSAAELVVISGAPAEWRSARRWLPRLIATRQSAAVLAGFCPAALRLRMTMALSFPASRTAPPTGVLAGAVRRASPPAAISLRLAAAALLCGQAGLLRVPLCVFFRHAGAIPSVERRPEHIIREEILSIDRHHHDLQFV